MTPSTEKKLDAVFSLYIRHKYSIDGYCRCYTCGTPIPIAQAQNGHCLGRSNRGVRFNENDCRPQCLPCNYFNKDMDAVFKMKLIREIGAEEYGKLTQLSFGITQMPEYEAKEMIELYKQKLKEL